MSQRYDTVLFDADNTLFDFDAAEAQALDLTLEAYGYPVDGRSRDCYLAVNRDLWERFDRGEVKREWLVVERFAALQRSLGGHHDPAEMNAFYLSRLAEAGCLLPGAEELCRALVPSCTLAIVTNGVASAQRGRFARSPPEGADPLALHLGGGGVSEAPAPILRRCAVRHVPASLRPDCGGGGQPDRRHSGRRQRRPGLHLVQPQRPAGQAGHCPHL